MGKQATPKAGGAIVKKQASWKNKPAMGQRKNEKKRGEIASAVDLRQPKEPDPVEAWIQQILGELEKIRTTGLPLHHVAQVAALRSDSLEVGNALFQRWHESFPRLWNQDCETFDAPFLDVHGKVSIEGRIEHLFEEHEGITESIVRHIAALFDLDNLSGDSSPFNWSLRCVGMQIVRRDPFSFFKVNEVLSTKQEHYNTLYWYPTDDEGVMKLRHTTPLVTFWVICSNLFQHPWATTFNMNLGTAAQVPIYVPGVTDTLIAVYEKYEKETGLASEEEPTFRVPFPSSTATKAPPTLQASAATTGTSDGSHRTPDNFTKGQGEKEGAPLTSIRNERETPKRKEVRMEVSAPSDSIIASNDDETISEMTGTTGATGSDKSPATNSRRSPQTYREAAMTVKSPPTTQRIKEIPKGPSSVFDHMDRLVQMNMEGLPGQGHIFDISLALTYNGEENGSNALTDAWVKQIQETMAEAIENSPPNHQLKLLPIDDSEYRNTSLWLTTAEMVQSSIKSFRDLGRYMDLNYGNAPYFTTSYQPGEKKLRTRFRFGFLTGVDHDRIRSHLHMGIQHQGRNTGCFDTPLQYSPIERAGFICFWPEDINITSMVRELMRYFEFKIPIGMKQDWVSLPYVGRGKFDERAPGTRQFHLFTRQKDVREVDRRCREWLVPSTPIADLPWCAKAHYVHDWNAARKGLLTTKAHALLKDLVLTMASKGQDFQDLTVVLYPSVRIHGMLKVAKTTHFGECSFLKMWHAIKCTPRQAAQASAEEIDRPQTPPSETEKDDFRKVRVSKKKARKTAEGDQDPSVLLSSFEELTKQMKPAQAKVICELERKQKQDMENNTPCKLFIAVFPGVMEGTYAFVCRRKFEALAKNVLRDVVPFFNFHLNEPSDAKLTKILSKWVSGNDIQRSFSQNLEWDPERLSARRTNHNTAMLDDGLDFLDGFGEDPLDIYDGTLTIDLNIANSKDIDDGATVAGAMEDLRATEAQLEDAFTEIEIQGQQIEERDKKLAAQHKALEEERERTKAIQARLEAIMQQQGNNMVLAHEPLTQPVTNDASGLASMNIEAIPSPTRTTASKSNVPSVTPAQRDMEKQDRIPDNSSVTTAASTRSTNSMNRPLHPYFNRSKAPQSHSVPPRDGSPAAESK